MAKKVDFSSIVESKGESTWYKQAIDDTARYKQAKEIEVEKNILAARAKYETEKNGKSIEERKKLQKELNKYIKQQHKQLEDECDDYKKQLSEIELARDLRNLEKLQQERKNIYKQEEVDKANAQLSLISDQIKLDAEVTKVRSKDYQAYVSLMQKSDAIRLQASIQAEKEARKLLASTLAKDPTALKAFKNEGKDKIKELKKQLKEANTVQDINRAKQLKQQLKDEKAARKQYLEDNADVIADADREVAENYRKELAEKDANSTVKRDGTINVDKLKNSRDAAAASGDLAGQLSGALKVALGTGWNKALSSVDDYLAAYTQNFTSVTTRLQNSGYTYENINKVFKANTAANPYVRYDKLLTKLNSLVEEGVAKGVAQRAFLGTIAEEVATTFDATQASLLQIVRIQQTDTTAQRLGLEANLTRLFNYYFGDTSYLSQAFDSVQQTLIGTSSQMSADASIEFEYIVQKWLGSLGSVGVDSSTLQTIAEGINYLGTGNVEALSSNSALQNLLVMSANRAGLNYGTLLTKGLNSSETNTLLKSLIQYVQEISNSNNNVVKSAYANLFGVKISDMAAFNNLDSTVINQIYQQAMTSNDTITELQWQLGQADKRYHLSTKIQNLLDNTFMGIGMGVANNAATYGLYKAASMLEAITGGINLPVISIMGNSFDPKMSLEGLIKTGVVGFSAIGQLVSSIGNIFSGSALDINKWDVNTNKGKGFRGFTNGNAVSQTTSQATYVSNSNATGTKQALVDQQKAEASTVSGEEDKDNPFSKKATDEGGADYWTNILLAIQDAVTGVLDVRVTNTVQLAGMSNMQYNDSSTAQGPSTL